MADALFSATVVAIFPRISDQQTRLLYMHTWHFWAGSRNSPSAHRASSAPSLTSLAPDSPSLPATTAANASSEAETSPGASNERRLGGEAPDGGACSSPRCFTAAAAAARTLSFPSAAAETSEMRGFARWGRGVFD